MVTIPFLGRMVWDFLVLAEDDVQKKFAWNCYVFLLAIFVAMTNQVIRELFCFDVQKKTRGIIGNNTLIQLNKIIDYTINS